VLDDEVPQDTTAACLPGDEPVCTDKNYNLIETPAELAALRQCSSIRGVLTLAGLDWLQSVDLPCLEIVGGLEVLGNPALESLSSLSALKSIGGDLNVRGNPLLQSLHGLQNVASVAGGVDVWDNERLHHTTALASLQTVGQDFVLFGDFESLDGLQRLSAVGGSLALPLDGLTTLAGLDGLEHIGGHLSISDAPRLVDLRGMGSLRTIGGFFFMMDNPSLQTTAGLESLSEVGSLMVQRNPVLQELSGMRSLRTIEEDALIEGNPQLHTLGLSSLIWGGDFEVVDNDLLGGLQGLEALEGTWYMTVRGNDSLSSLEGLESLQSATVVTVEDNAQLEWVASLTSLADVDSLVFVNNPSLVALDLPVPDPELYALVFEDNPSLTSLAGASGVDRADIVRLSNNDALRSLAHLDALTWVGREVVVEGNAQLCSAEAEAFGQRFEQLATVSVSDNAPCRP
jgi:hypothetical protein